MRLGGPWDREAVAAFLAEAVIPVRLSAIAPSGAPIVASHWFLYEDDALWCALNPASDMARFLKRDPRCAFEVAADAPPYRGVRGQAEAMFEPGGLDLLKRLLDRYFGDRETEFADWLIARSADELAVRIRPLRLSSWDYSGRMQSVVPAGD